MPKEYKGTRLYTDVNKKDLKASKRELLKEMALSGTHGMERLAAETEQSNAPIDYDRYDQGVGGSSPDNIRAALNAERQKLLGGYDVARGMQGRAHSEELDRIAAANSAFKDAMKLATNLSRDALKERISAMKMAYDATGGGSGRGGGGGGRGGGGGSSGSGSTALSSEVLPELSAAQSLSSSGRYRTLSDDLRAAGAYLGHPGTMIAERVAGTPAHQQFDASMEFYRDQGYDFATAKQLATQETQDAIADGYIPGPDLGSGMMSQALGAGVWDVLGNNWAGVYEAVDQTVKDDRALSRWQGSPGVSRGQSGFADAPAPGPGPLPNIKALADAAQRIRIAQQQSNPGTQYSPNTAWTEVPGGIAQRKPTPQRAPQYGPGASGVR